MTRNEADAAKLVAAEARRANEQYLKRLSDAGHDNESLRGRVERTLAYLLGDSKRYAHLSPQERDNPNLASGVNFVADLESGDRRRISRLVDKDEGYWETQLNVLTLGLAWQVAGDRSAAGKCFEDAAERFASGGRDQREISRLLKQGDKLIC